MFFKNEKESTEKYSQKQTSRNNENNKTNKIECARPRCNRPFINNTEK